MPVLTVRHYCHDQLDMGKKARIPTMVDKHFQRCPAAEPRFAYRREDVVQMPETVRARIGYRDGDTETTMPPCDFS